MSEPYADPAPGRATGRMPSPTTSPNGDEPMQAMHTTYSERTTGMTTPTTRETTAQRTRGRRRGAHTPILLHSLAAANAAGVHEVVIDALERLWFSGFCAGAASVAPDRVRRCVHCNEPFVAGHGREIYCKARCRNTAVKRRYRARVQARASRQPLAGGESL